MSVGVFLFLDVWRGVSIDLGDIFGMPELLGGVFGDSLHEGFAQTGANSLFWPNPKRQEFFHLPFLRHQNIKTSLYAISKYVRVLPFFLIFMSVREKLQFTVFFDHPVCK